MTITCWKQSKWKKNCIKNKINFLHHLKFHLKTALQLNMLKANLLDFILFVCLNMCKDLTSPGEGSYYWIIINYILVYEKAIEKLLFSSLHQLYFFKSGTLQSRKSFLKRVFLSENVSMKNSVTWIIKNEI